MRLPRLTVWMALFCLCVLCSGAIAQTDKILTPTSAKVMADEDKEFNAAMKVWYSHRYEDGVKLLREFSKKHPNSRWAAEADLHVGCNLVFTEKYAEAKAIFEDVIKKHPGSQVDIKAKIRLGNIAERTNKIDEAVGNYSAILKMNPTGDQFKYANYRVRDLAKRKRFRQASIHCGPVALAECLESLGKAKEAYQARNLPVGEDGVSMWQLATHAETLGQPAQAVNMSVEELTKAKLPILAHVRGNHFLAVLSIADGKVLVSDSIKGKREIALSELTSDWSGKVLTFDLSTGLPLLASAEASSILGGCYSLFRETLFPKQAQ